MAGPAGDRDGALGQPHRTVTLADGRTVIVKHLDPRLDLTLRGLDYDGRLARLWDAGVFERMPRVVRERADLDWWVARVGRELDAWGPI